VPADAPYVEIEVPSAVDPTLTDDGSCVMTLFTQYGPHDESGWPEGAREAYGERCLEIVARRAPNVKDALIHHEVLAPPDLESIFGLHGGSIFQGEQGLEQDGVHAPLAAARPVRDAGGWALPVRGGHAPGRRGDGRLRAQRGDADPEGPQIAEATAATRRPFPSVTTFPARRLG
jgi:phytoene dehydrogenase-like protein